jgi:flagellar M-ring protein FliF
MPEWFERLVADIAGVWEKAPSSQRWVIGGVAATLIAGLVGITMALYVFPSGELLATGLGPRELARYVNFLEENGTRYDIRDNGTSIYVYASAPKIKGQFAFSGEAKPLGGYGHLLGPNWGKTRDQFRETSLRAHSEELETGIVQGSDRIEFAEVYLNRGKEGLFKTSDQKPTASVKIGTGGLGIERKHVQGIQWLVANSMPGLLPEDVMVMDESNEVLAGYEKKSETERVTSERRSAELALEDKLEKKLGTILNPLVGGVENRSIAVVVKLDWDKKTLHEKIIDTNEPLESFVKTEEIEEKNQPVGGVPGTPSNNPEDTLSAAPAGGQTSSLMQNSSEITSEPRRTLESTTEVAPGAILKQQVTVTINEKQFADGGEIRFEARSAEELEAIGEQLKVAVGHIESSTKFSFSFREVPFDRSAREIALAETRRKKLVQNLESGVFLFFAVALIVVFFIFLKKVFSMKPQEVEVEEEIESVSAEDSLAELGLRALGDDEGLSAEAKKSRMIREQVEVFTLEHPDAASDIVKSWLSE